MGELDFGIVDYAAKDPTNARISSGDYATLDEVAKAHRLHEETYSFPTRRKHDIIRGSRNLVAGLDIAAASKFVDTMGDINEFFDLAAGGTDAQGLIQAYGRLAKVEAGGDSRVVRALREFSGGQNPVL